jgi:hypothetical protein
VRIVELVFVGISISLFGQRYYESISFRLYPYASPFFVYGSILIFLLNLLEEIWNLLYQNKAPDIIMKSVT